MSLTRIIQSTFLQIGTLMLFAMFQNGCASHIPPYNAVVRNIGNDEVSELKIVWGEYGLGVGGWLMPKQDAMHSKPEVPIPEKATLTWKRGDGTIFRQEVIVKKILPLRLPKEEYYLIFNIDDQNNVMLKVVLCVPGEPCREKW